jgi:hypothetical protein
MQGNRPLAWLWQWLSIGNTGEQYELLPSVQPVAIVDGIEMPRRVVQFASGAINLQAGTFTNTMPNPANPDGTRDLNRTRIWLDIFHSRSNVVATDALVLVRQVQNNLNAIVMTQSGILAPANVAWPSVGGVYTGPVGAAGAFITVVGHAPLAIQPDQNLLYSITAAAAVGTIAFVGDFIDVPATAPLPSVFQL